MSISRNKSVSFWSPGLTGFIFLLSAFILLILLPLFQKGTFIDGMLYKTVAYNFSEGLSSFWGMKFTDTSMEQFCEQPPLYFSVLGVYYQLFGTGLFADRFFTLLLFLFFIALLFLVVKELFPRPLGFFGWTCLFLLSVPVLCWSFVNQVIEPLVCVWVTAGVLFFLQYLRTGKGSQIILFLFVLVLLFLSKGFQSCFIIGLPLTYFLAGNFNKKSARIAVGSGLGLVVILFLLIHYYPPAWDWFYCYYQSRLVLTMNNVGGTTDQRLEIILRFFSELIIPLSILVITLLAVSIKKKYPLKKIIRNFLNDKLALSLLITSFLGSFPYAMSLVQRGFYLVPSFICFVLAVVYGFRRYWLFLFSAVGRILASKIVVVVVYLIFGFSIVWSMTHLQEYKKDEALQKDLSLILPHLQKKEIIEIEGDLWNYFSLHAYLYMEKQVSMTENTTRGAVHVLRKKGYAGAIREGYEKIPIPTVELDLYVKRNP